MNNGATTAKAWNLRPGIALSAAQMAQLTSDIVWLVEKTITLADGSTTSALTPQLYARVRQADLQSGGALIAGNDVKLDITGDLLNGGVIAGRQVVALTAQNINNLQGRLFGNDIGLSARTDLNNIGGMIEANDNLAASAGRDLNVASRTRTQTNAQGSQTNLERVAGLYVTGATGTLLTNSGRDTNLIAAAIQNQGSGDTGMTANNDIHLGGVTQSNSHRIVWNGSNGRSDASSIETGSSIQTKDVWPDTLTEAFSGTHDMIGGKISGLYDEQGNAERGRSKMEKTAQEAWSATGAIVASAPFATAEFLPSEVWKAISILLGAAK